MDEDTIIPLPEDGQPEKKKRGRKPKLQAETPAAADAEGKPARKRGRPKKIKPEDAAPSGDAGVPAPIPSGPQWRDMPPSDIEHYSPENEIFTGSDGGDDFAYSKSGRADFRGDDGEIPPVLLDERRGSRPRFLPQPAGAGSRNRRRTGGRAPRRKPPTKYCPSPTPLTNPLRRPRPRARTAATTAGTGSRTTGIIPAARGKIRASKIKTRNSSKTAAAGRTGSSQTRTASSQTSRDSNRAAGQNPRQQNQNRQPQQQKKKPAWKQADADSEAMNPGDLPDWEVLKSEAGISRWLEGIFEGKSASDSGMGTGARTETGESPEAAAPEQEAAEDTPAQAPVPPEEMSYWQLLSSSNDSRIERPAKPEAGGTEPAPEHGNPPRETASGANLAAVSENPKTAPGIFGRDFFPFARRFRHRLRHRLRRIVPSSHKGFAREVRRAFNSPQRRGVKGGNSRRIFPRRARREKTRARLRGPRRIRRRAWGRDNIRLRQLRSEKFVRLRPEVLYRKIRAQTRARCLRARRRSAGRRAGKLPVRRKDNLGYGWSSGSRARYRPVLRPHALLPDAQDNPRKRRPQFQRQPLHARRRPPHSDRLRPARADSGSSPHRQDYAHAGNGEIHTRQQPGRQADNPARRRAPRGSHRLPGTRSTPRLWPRLSTRTPQATSTPRRWS